MQIGINNKTNNNTQVLRILINFLNFKNELIVIEKYKMGF